MHLDPYKELQNDLGKYITKSKNVLLFGDFNSRTGIKNDYVNCDKFISQLQGNEELYSENLDILDYFDECGIPLQRNNADENSNYYGPQLLEMCKYNNLFILNDRLGTDNTLPKQHVRIRVLYIISFHQPTFFLL